MTELAAVRNPFRDNVVQDAWQNPADVVDIHSEVFRACLAGIDSASGGVPDSLLIYGPAGSGKTHLLTRLQRHLAQTARDAPDQVLRCVFVFVRLQTAPQLLWQHVRKRLATDLMRSDQGLTQLQRLIAHQIAVRAGKSPRAAVFRVRVLEGDNQAALAQQVSELTSSLNLPRDLSLVVEHLTLNRSVRDATAWLSGESLPESALAQLGLGPDGQEDREQAAREAVTALCRLAGETLPIVFCFDQVEALQRSSDDKEAFFRFGQMGADLHDTDPNVFLVTCLQSAALTLFRDAIRIADFQRMAKRHAVLEPLNPKQVEQLIHSRLESATELAELRRQQPKEPFFPFRRTFISELSADPPSCVPRVVLAQAARRFEEVQHHRATDRIDTSEFLATELFLRKQAAIPELAPADTTRLVIQGSQLLAKLEGQVATERESGNADLVLSGGRTKVALSVRNEADGRSLGPKLKALLDEHPRQDKARLVIVRDPRLTIAKTAVKTREHLAKLQAQGAVVVEPTLAALAALEALQSIISDAKSGDLANDGEPVSEGPVLAWLKSLKDDVLLEPLFELFDAIVTDGERPAQRAEEQDLAELIAREHVIELATLSQRLGHSADVLLQIARHDSERYLILEGPPVVLSRHRGHEHGRGNNMTMELSVADVRGALLRSAPAGVAGNGEAATLLLGRLFHEVFADLVSDDPQKSGLRVITEAPEAGEQRVQSLLEHTWRQLIAPRLRRQAASLQSSSERVLLLWRANQNLARWLVSVVTELVGQSAQPRESWQHLTELIRSEVPLSCELQEPGWSEPVRLVGIADSILRVPGKPHYCALELKLGRCAPVVDLGQAALYHLLLTRTKSNVSRSALALLRFSPDLDEQLVDADALGNVQKTLLLLIADLAGVSGHKTNETGRNGATSGHSTKAGRSILKGGASAKRAAEPKRETRVGVHETASSADAPRLQAQPTAKQAELAPTATSSDLQVPSDPYTELTKRLVRAYKEQGVGIEVREPPIAGPRFLRFSVRLASGVKVDALRRRTAEVQHRLELAREPMVTQEAGRLFVDVERPDPQTVLFSSITSQLPAVDPLTGSARLPIGVDATGKLHWADLASAGRSHVLAAGTTGSGKSEWLRMTMAALMASNTPDTLRFVTLDPKLAAFNDLERSDFLWRKDAWWIPGNDRPASEVFEDLIAEMDRRYQLTRQTSTDNLRDHIVASGKPLPRIVCVCDEYFALVSQSKEEGRAIEEAVAKLGAKARAAGIHLVLATQQPSRKIINGNIQSNLPCRVALMLQSHIESTMILNTSGAERLTGSGDLLYRDFGDPIRLQAPYLPPAERAKWLQR